MNPPLQTVQDRQRLLLEQADSMVFKTVDPDPDLNIHFYLPDSHTEGPPRPVILFFFSSGWDRGHVTQFAPQALHFADRGAVTGLVEYRTDASHGASPVQAMQDGRSAVRWVRENAERLNIDPERVTVAGGRAGGLIAGTLLLSTKLQDDPDDNTETDGKPNCAMLFSSMIDLDKDAYGVDRFASVGEAKSYGLSQFITFSQRPLIIFHGTADRFIDYKDVEHFAKKLKRKKNVCEFFPFDGRDENFYNLNVDPFSYEAVLEQCDRFLVENGMLNEKGDGEEDARLISWRENDF